MAHNIEALDDGTFILTLKGFNDFGNKYIRQERIKHHAKKVIEQQEQQIKELKESQDDAKDAYWNGYSDGFNSSQDLSIEYFENKDHD